jgi:hypothetical protein
MDDHAVVTVKPTTFDYRLVDLDPKTVEKLRSMAERVRSKLKKIEHDYIEVGRVLLSAKVMLEHGAFGRWVDSIGLSASTARNFMRAAEFIKAQENRNVVDLLPAAAIYKLVAPSTPPAVREDIIARLEKGEAMSTKAITQEITARRQKSAELPAKQQQQSKQSRASKEVEELLETEARQLDEEAAARQAVTLLRDRLFGDQFKEFVNLFEQSGSQFRPELHKELAAKDARP